MTEMPEPVEVFYSYAESDEPWCVELEKHLSQLRRDGLITTWHKRQIPVGTNSDEHVNEHLNRAGMILLVVSSDFVASDYCYGQEMVRAMERNAAGEAHVIPILLRPVEHWQGAPFGKLQVLPRNGKPVVSWPQRDDAFVDIASGIRAVLQAPKHSAIGPATLGMPAIWNVPYPRNPFFIDV